MIENLNTSQTRTDFSWVRLCAGTIGSFSKLDRYLTATSKLDNDGQFSWGNRFLHYRGRLCIGATDSFTTEVDCVLRRGGDPHPKTHFLEKAGDHNFACPSDQLAKHVVIHICS